MAFWRRTRGRHALGAALENPPRSASELGPARPDSGGGTRQDDGPQPPVATWATPRVELTFTDGTRATVDSDSARALHRLAAVLLSRD